MNKKFKKKCNKVEFLKLLIVNKETSRCEFCKYNWRNYIYSSGKIQHMIINHFANMCNVCINNRVFLKLQDEEKHKKYWYIDKFKPLYEWENFDSQGEKNE